MEAVIALRQVHAIAPNPGIAQLITEKAYFTFQMSPEQTEPEQAEAHAMVTQKIEGLPLSQWIEQNGALQQDLAFDWLQQLITSANALHEQGFLHRDIKPDNIIVASNQQIVLIDFGALCRIDPKRSTNPQIKQGTETYPVAGTYGYMPPEQSDGRPEPASDYFAIARTLIHALTATHPSDLDQQPNGAIQWRNLAPQVSEPFAEFLDRLATPNHLYRPASAKEIVAYIDDLPSRIAADQKRRRRQKLKKLTAPILLALGIPLVLLAGAAWSKINTQSRVNRLFSEGNQLISLNQPEQAIPVLQSALELQPEAAEIISTIALAQSLSGDNAAAVVGFEEALELEPNNPFIRFNLANVYEQVDMEQAITNYQIAAKEESPIQAAAVNNLARVYILAGQLEDANKLLSRQSETEDSVTQAALLKNRGWLQVELGNKGQAQSLLNQSIALNPARPDAYCLLAIITANEDDRITCISLPTPSGQPEIQQWKNQLSRMSDRPNS
ncbi:MAG: AarF/UbiB family protein [Cyanobacteria bacterium J06649_5]